MAEQQQTTTSSPERSRSEVVNEKLGNFKKFASTSFTRAKQFTIEKMGKAESVTTYDEEFEELYCKVTQIKNNTEKILAQVDSMVQPNPGIRIETKVYSRLDRPGPQHSSPHSLLGMELSRAGNEFGPETQYGGYLVRCGEVESKIGMSEKKYQDKVNVEVVVPLRSFLEVDIKNVLREHRTLYVKRLDLDSCRSDVKKAQQDTKLQMAETALRETQADYDMQLDLVRQGMRRIVDTHVNNLGRMKTLMSSLKAYYMECIAHIDDINTDASLHSSVLTSVSSDRGDSVKGKALYDFDATEGKEISVLTGQIILVFLSESDDDYYMVQVDSKFGFVPKSYIELL